MAILEVDGRRELVNQSNEHDLSQPFAYALLSSGSQPIVSPTLKGLCKKIHTYSIFQILGCSVVCYVADGKQKPVPVTLYLHRFPADPKKDYWPQPRPKYDFEWKEVDEIPDHYKEGPLI